MASSVYECQAAVALSGKRVGSALESVVISEAVRRSADLHPDVGSRSAMLFAFPDYFFLCVPLLLSFYPCQQAHEDSHQNENDDIARSV